MPFNEARLPSTAKCLVVFLPGSGDRAADFAKNGFVDAVRARGLSVDLVSADATNTYYFRRDVYERLEADVIGPAQARGYSQTWLIGNSLGGLGSLTYAQRNPGTVQGIVALAPFPGQDAALQNEVRRAGSLASWDPGVVRDDESYSRSVWRWLREVTVQGAAGPELFIGWGDQDKFAKDDALMASALPKERVLHARGGHTWKTWRGLFDQFLSESTFAQRCAP